MIDLRTSLVVLPAALLATMPLAAKDKEPPPRPAVVEGVYACQTIADTEQRLACFDAAVDKMKTEEAQRNVIFADRAQVKEAKKGLFGLGNIRLGIFGGGDDEAEEERLKEIDAKVASVGQVRGGQLYIVLDDGARWEQTDMTQVRMRDLKAGTIKIKRASMGGFIAQLGDGRFFSVKRVQ